LAFVLIGDYFDHHTDDTPGSQAAQLRWRRVRRRRRSTGRTSLPLNQEHHKSGVVTFTALAAALNETTPAPRGGQWSAVQVKCILGAVLNQHRAMA